MSDDLGMIVRNSAAKSGRDGKHKAGLPSMLPVYDEGGTVQTLEDVRKQVGDYDPVAPQIEATQRKVNKDVTKGIDLNTMPANFNPKPIPVYDDGTGQLTTDDVNVDDGKHQVAVLKEGEKVLTPEQAQKYDDAQNTPELIPTRQQSSQLISEPTQSQKPRTGYDYIDAGDRDISRATPQERQAVKVDQQAGMGGGVKGLTQLAVANVHAKQLGLKPIDLRNNPSSDSHGESTSYMPKIANPHYSDATESAPDMPIIKRSAGEAVVGYPQMLLPGEKPIMPTTRDMAGDVIGNGELAPIGLKATAAKLRQDHANALAERTPEGKAKADYIQAQIADLQKSNPLGSKENHPGFMGQLSHTLARIGNVAGDVLAPGTMQLIPGTDLNKQAHERGLQAETQADTELATQRETADTARAREEREAEDSKEAGWTLSDKFTGPNGEPIEINKSGQVRFAPEGIKLAKEQKGTPANDTQITQAVSQLPAITRALSADERKVFEFPTGYKPTVEEIKANNELAGKANAEKLAGNRDAAATTAAQAAANKRTMEEKMVEQIATDIAPMDINSLSQLKTITSMRSDQRSLIYARAKELNPQFNTAEVDRKVKMLDNFTNGKDAQNIQSFGTFFEHGGNASHIVNDLRNSLTPDIVNVALNKLENKGWGTTATQISAALEPVRKEFESFLLGGRALYADDRKAAETILSDASTPAQIQAALKVLAHTASARYNEMDTRFKNTMKVNISEGVGPLAPEAYNGAEAIGVTELGGKVLRNGEQGYGWYSAKGK